MRGGAVQWNTVIISQTEMGSDAALGTLLAGGLEQVTYLFESIFVYKEIDLAAGWQLI